MTERKVQRHHVYIGALLDADAKFTKTISCPFVPDEVKVKQFAAAGDPISLTRAYQLQCPTLTSDFKVPLCSYVVPSVSFVGITFTLGKSIDGSHDFSIVDSTGTADPAYFAEYISILLEFRKYT